jgi:lysophospholipase L1-like esterase
MKKALRLLLSKLLLVCGSLLFLLLIAEGGVRLEHWCKETISGNTLKPFMLEPKLGWRPTPNYHFTGKLEDASGQFYSVTIHTDSNGFRSFGNTDSQKRKVLFLGDSFTHAVQASDEDVYFKVLGNRLPIEVFAFGCGGYGTLQEYMILDQFLDVIRPDSIVLQLGGNDFINNDYELELKSGFNNNGMVRPYLKSDDTIFYAMPRSHLSGLKAFANRYSYFLYSIFSRTDQFFAKRHLNDSAEVKIELFGKDFEPFKNAANTTEKLIHKIRTRVSPNVKIYAFEVLEKEPYHQTFKEISQRQGIEFIEGVSKAVEDAAKKGVSVKAFDKGHWNNTGHQIAANVLYDYLKDQWNDVRGH